ncbi:MAG: cytochrome c [Cryomorphaceae bacterium]|nr:cytochrome c [Cryomorphaceae bacterium]
MSSTVKITLFFALFAFILQGCGGESGESTTGTSGPKPKPKTETPVAETKPDKVEEPEVEDDGKGFGSITEVNLGSGIDGKMASKGEELFGNLCAACHKMEDRTVGPPMAGITERRKPEWIMNMILHPEIMLKKDPTAKKLLAEYKAPMANQNLSEEQARSLLEYFRQYDASK